MVGAGGIGCELVKNLVMTGFKDIVMVQITSSSFLLGLLIEGFNPSSTHSLSFPTHTHTYTHIQREREKESLVLE